MKDNGTDTSGQGRSDIDWGPFAYGFISLILLTLGLLIWNMI